MLSLTETLDTFERQYDFLFYLSEQDVEPFLEYANGIEASIDFDSIDMPFCLVDYLERGK